MKSSSFYFGPRRPKKWFLRFFRKIFTKKWAGNTESRVRRRFRESRVRRRFWESRVRYAINQVDCRLDFQPHIWRDVQPDIQPRLSNQLSGRISGSTSSQTSGRKTIPESSSHSRIPESSSHSRIPYPGFFLVKFLEKSGKSVFRTPGTKIRTWTFYDFFIRPVFPLYKPLFPSS